MTPRGKGPDEDGTRPSAVSRSSSVEGKAAALVALIETFAEEGRTASEIVGERKFAELRSELVSRGSY